MISKKLLKEIIDLLDFGASSCYCDVLKNKAVGKKETEMFCREYEKRFRKAHKELTAATGK